MLVLPKNLIRTDLSLSAYAVYPVLQYFAKQDYSEGRDWFEINTRKISEKAGINLQTTRKALSDLLDRRKKLIKHIPHPKKSHRKMPVYTFVYNPAEESIDNDFFIFDDALIKFNIWAGLLPRTKALYLALLANAEMPENIIEYAKGNVEVEEIIYRKGSSRWMVCDVQLKKIAAKINVSYSGCSVAVKELENYQLAYKVNKVFLVR